MTEIVLVLSTLVPLFSVKAEPCELKTSLSQGPLVSTSRETSSYPVCKPQIDAWDASKQQWKEPKPDLKPQHQTRTVVIRSLQGTISGLTWTFPWVETKLELILWSS